MKLMIKNGIVNTRNNHIILVHKFDIFLLVPCMGVAGIDAIGSAFISRMVLY